MSNKSFWQRRGYDVEVHLGNRTITTTLKDREYGLCDSMVISASENSARTANFSFIPPEAIIDLDNYQGLPVVILIRNNTGWHQAFTGIVDIPVLDFVLRKVKVTCSDDRANKVIQLDDTIISQIGLYDTNVFGETSTDKSQELEKRLQTVVASFDFDRFGNPQLTPWLPKETPDFTLTSTDIKQVSLPSVEYTSRKKTINTVNLTFNFSYQRLHQQVASFIWPGYSDFGEWYNGGRPTFPTRDQVDGAATGSNWKLVNPSAAANYVPLWPAGAYNGIIWQPNQITSEYVGRTKNVGYLKYFDSTSGTYKFVTVGDPPRLVPQIVPVLDGKPTEGHPDGNQIMDEVKRTVVDTSSQLCRGVSFTSALRFSQNVTEVYRLNVVAPQSISRIGVVDSYTTIGITDPYDSTSWEQSEIVTQVTRNFYIDQASARPTLMHAIQTAYAKAKHDILQVHRDISVYFRTKLLKPTIDLIHTVSFSVSDPLSSTAHIDAVGKVSSVSHTFDFRIEDAWTDVTLALSKIGGSTTETDPYINIPVQNPGYIGPAQEIVLGTHLGIDPDPNVTVDADKWTGWIGNKYLPGNATQPSIKTNYSEAFIVDFPAIPDSLRDKITYESDTTLIVSIPNDPYYLETST